MFSENLERIGATVGTCALVAGLGFVVGGDAVWGAGGLVLGGAGTFWYGKHRRDGWWRRKWAWMLAIFSEQWSPSMGEKREVDLERRLRQVRLNERESFKEKSDLLAATVHDLKTPLLGIRELSALLLENESLSENGQSKLELIHRTSDEAMSRVSDLLSEMVQDDVPPMLESEVVDLSALAKRVVDRFRPRAESNAQTLQCTVPEEPCRVEGNVLRLREAASNLVNNALTYSPQEEAVEVRVSRSENVVRFAVSDNGPGLSDDDRSRLFASPQQRSSQPTGQERSNGIGLYVTKQIMDLHDGTIEVATTEGEGSTFVLVLPVASSSPQTD